MTSKNPQSPFSFMLGSCTKTFATYAFVHWRSLVCQMPECSVYEACAEVFTHSSVMVRSSTIFHASQMRSELPRWASWVTSIAWAPPPAS